MNFKNLMLAETFICIAFGLVYIVYPQYLVDEYMVDKTSLNSTVKIVALHYGSLLITVGVFFWLCRTIQVLAIQKKVLYISLLSNLFVVLISIYGIKSNIETSMTWSVVILCGALFAWAVALFMKIKD